MRYFERFVGFRYLFSNRKKSLLSITTLISLGGVAIGVMSLSVVTSVMNGFGKDIQSKILSFKSHMLIQSNDFLPFTPPVSLISNLKGLDPRIIEISPFVATEMIATYRSQLSGVIVKGIDEIQFKKLERGDKGTGILIGKELATNLYIEPGDELEILSPIETTGPLGISPKKKKYKVLQFFETGLYDVDSKYLYFPLSEIQHFLEYENKIDGIEIKISDIYAVNEIIAKIRTLPHTETLEIRGWPVLNKNIFGALKLEKMAMFVILSFIIVVAALNIITTITRMVIEKQREISILKTIGAQNGQILSVFLLQGLIIAGMGIVLGMSGGWLMCTVLSRYAFIHLPDIFYNTSIPVEMHLSQFMVIGITALFITGLCSFYPAWRASQLNPLDGIRY